MGAEGNGFGAALPLPPALSHPFTVWVTVYDPAVVTVMDVVVAPVFHNKDPVKLPAVTAELPQLFNTVTVGAEGIDFGAAALLAAALVQPLTV